MRDWRDELEEVVNRGRDTDGDSEVLAALEDVLRRIVPERQSVAPLAPPIAVLGLEECATGWVGVLVRPTGQTTLHLGATIDGLVEQVRQQETLGVLGISVPAAGAAEVATWRQSHPSVQVIEVDPRASFTRIGSNPASSERPVPLHDHRGLLAAVGITVPSMYPGMGFDEGDLFNACVAAWTVADRFC